MPLGAITLADKSAVTGAVLIGAGGSAIANILTGDIFRKNKRMAYLATALIVAVGIAFMAKSLEE